jgi:hypothetical protein
MKDFSRRQPNALAQRLGQFSEQCNDASPMARWAGQYARSLRCANPVVPILKFDMWIATDLCIVIDYLLFHQSETGAAVDSLLLLPPDTGHPLPEAPQSSPFGIPGGHLITVVVLVALLVTMPWWV